MAGAEFSTPLLSCCVLSYRTIQYMVCSASSTSIVVAYGPSGYTSRSLFIQYAMSRVCSLNGVCLVSEFVGFNVPAT